MQTNNKRSNSSRTLMDTCSSPLLSVISHYNTQLLWRSSLAIFLFYYLPKTKTKQKKTKIQPSHSSQFYLKFFTVCNRNVMENEFKNSPAESWTPTGRKTIRRQQRDLLLSQQGRCTTVAHWTEEDSRQLWPLLNLSYKESCVLCEYVYMCRRILKTPGLFVKVTFFPLSERCPDNDLDRYMYK